MGKYHIHKAGYIKFKPSCKLLSSDLHYYCNRFKNLLQSKSSERGLSNKLCYFFIFFVFLSPMYSHKCSMLCIELYFCNKKKKIIINSNRTLYSAGTPEGGNAFRACSRCSSRAREPNGSHQVTIKQRVALPKKKKNR